MPPVEQREELDTGGRSGATGHLRQRSGHRDDQGDAALHMGYSPDSGERSDERDSSRGGRRFRAEVELGDTALRRQGEGLGRCYGGGVVFGWWLDEGEMRGLLEF